MKKNIFFLVFSIVILSLVSGVFVAALFGYRQGQFEASMGGDSGFLVFADMGEVVSQLEGDSRGPVRDLLTTRNGVLVVFDDAIARFDTGPVGEVWSHFDLGGSTAAGVTADGERVVLAYEGSALFSGYTRWLVLEADTGEAVARHWSKKPPENLVSVLAAESRIEFSDDGHITARSLDEDREQWSYSPSDECTDSDVKAVGVRVNMVSVCDDQVKLAELSAETGELLDSRSWSGTEVPEFLSLTPRTSPGGSEDPIERIVHGGWIEGYVDLGDNAPLEENARPGGYLPPHAEPNHLPAYILLVEDSRDAQDRFALAVAKFFLEEGIVSLGELSDAVSLVDGELPESVQEWDTGESIQSGRLQVLLSDVVGKKGPVWDRFA